MAVENQFFTVGKVLAAQACMALLVSAVFFGFGGWQNARSPLAGALIALLPNLLFAFRVYAARNAKPGDMLQAFYTGEVLKLLLTAGLFALALQLPHVNFLALLAGYIAVLSVFWFALFYWRN